MARMIRDAKFRMNDGGDASARPERPSEAMGFGAVLQQGRQAGELVGGQSSRGTGTWTVAEGLRTTLLASLHPLTDRALADAQGRGDLALRPALLFEAPSL
jgi:hypothetical protein